MGIYFKEPEKSEKIIKKKSKNRKKRRKRRASQSPLKIEKKAADPEKKADFELKCEFLKEKVSQFNVTKAKRKADRGKLAKKRELLFQGFANNWAEISKKCETAFESAKRNAKILVSLRTEAQESYKNASKEFTIKKKEIEREREQEMEQARAIGLGPEVLGVIMENANPQHPNLENLMPRKHEFFAEFSMFRTKFQKSIIDDSELIANYIQDFSEYLGARRELFKRLVNEPVKTEIIEELVCPRQVDCFRIVRNYEEDIMKLEFGGFELVSGGEGSQTLDLKSTKQVCGENRFIRVWGRQICPEVVENKSEFMKELIDLENKLKEIKVKFTRYGEHFESIKSVF